jgi:hypothetical protein
MSRLATWGVLLVTLLAVGCGDGRARVEGTFIRAGGGAAASTPDYVDGDVHLLGEDGRTWTTRSEGGRWAIRVPHGSYIVSGVTDEVSTAPGRGCALDLPGSQVSLAVRGDTRGLTIICQVR